MTVEGRNVRTRIQPQDTWFIGHLFPLQMFTESLPCARHSAGSWIYPPRNKHIFKNHLETPFWGSLGATFHEYVQICPSDLAKNEALPWQSSEVLDPTGLFLERPPRKLPRPRLPTTPLPCMELTEPRCLLKRTWWKRLRSTRIELWFPSRIF